MVRIWCGKKHRQAEEEGEKKGEKKGAEMDSPGVSNPFPGTLQNAIASHYKPFANADPLLPR